MSILTSEYSLPSSNCFNIPGKGLKLFHLNICSLLPKIDELKFSEGVLNNKATVIGINESHLNSSIDKKEICIKGYQLYRRDRVAN